MNPIGNMLLPNGEIILKSIKCVHWEIINGEFKLTPSIREYYGVHAGETIFKMAFVFRSEDGSKTGKTADGGDIFIDGAQRRSYCSF